MARRSAKEHYNRTITRVAGGKSTCVTLPQEYLLELGWNIGDQVQVVKNETNESLELKLVQIQNKKKR